MQGDSHTQSRIELARRLVAATVAADGLEGPPGLVRALCRTAAGSLSMRGCSLHLVTSDGAAGLVASTDGDGAQAAADLAFTVGEGPSLDAFTLRRPVLVGDMDQVSRRWPGYASAADDAGVHAVFSVPVQVGGVVLGVLDLFDDRPRSLTEDEIGMALAFAQLTVEVLLGATTTDGAASPLLDHRAEIHQAQGMVMVDLGIELAEALLRMRAHAFSRGLPLIEVANGIIGGDALPREDEEDPV